jgi:hypothetical protein
MKVAGFTFVRNAIKFDYPIREAIESILPLCDLVIVAVGDSEDETLALIQGMNSPKIRIIQTVWNDALREGGRVLAEETNKAFQAIPDEYDWAFYIQGDEVVPEYDLPVIRAAMQRFLTHQKVDGLLFNYRHFFGSYDYIGNSPRWYTHEIRVVRNDKSIYSFRDAQGFRKGNDEKLRVKSIAAHIHHYGWVKDPRTMQAKQESFNRLWHDDTWMEENVPKVEAYDYFKNIDTLEKFNGKHPQVMEDRIQRLNWEFNYDISFNKTTLKTRVKKGLKSLGIDASYRNYKII